MDGYVSAKDVRTLYRVSPSTLRVWETKGKLRCVRMPGGKRLYERKSVAGAFGQAAEDRKRVLYARVSSLHQEAYPDCDLLCDITSGIDFKRPGLQAVLERVLVGSVSHLVVAHRARLARFGLDLLDWRLAKYSCTLVVLRKSNRQQGPSELADDIMAVTPYVRTTAAAVLKTSEKATRLKEAAAKRRLGKHLGAAKRQATFNQETYVPPPIAEKDLFTRKAKLRPTPLQKKLLDKWASCSNQVYNLCVNEYRIQGVQPQRATLRALLKDTWKVEKPWLATVPYEILDASIDDFDAIFKQQATLRKEKRLAGDTTPTPFTIKFRSKKSSSVSLKVRCRASYKTSVSEGGQVRACFYVTKMDAFLREELGLPKGRPLSDDVLYSAGKELPLDITHDSELVRTPLGEYFFCYSMDRPPPAHRTESTRLRVVAGDPGVRTFTTFYDPDGYVIEVGANDMPKLRNRGNAVDILKAKIAHYRKKKAKVKVRRMRRALLRAEEKIRNLVDEVHKKSACFLENQYDVVILPKFGVKDMTKRERRKINRKTTRDMLTWAHARFRERLRYKLGDRLVDCSEDYTSKTCTRCGKINQHLGGNKTFHCRDCGLVVDRDHGAARNILLRNVSLSTLRHTGTSLLAREWVSAPAA